MALPKKNQMTQILFLMVDGTDFATIESGLTAMPTGKFYGVNHGVSTAMTSGAISKTISHVRSGLYRATIKAAEANYDFVDYRFIHASAADQHVQMQYRDADDSDLLSMMVLIQSLASDAASAAQQANSRVLLNLSRISDIASFLVVMSGMVSDVDSALSSQFAAGQALDASTLSDLRSAITAAQSINASDFSDLRSAIAGVTATLSVSDISDIASAVRAVLVSDLSDILSAAQQTNSRVLLTQSRVSDTLSMLSDFYSDFQSRVPKLVATNSQVSDLHSDLRSFLVVLSDQISDLNSDMRSLVTTTGVQLNASSFSDLRSAIAAVTVAVTVSDISDIASAVWANTIGARVDSRILLSQSRISDTYSMLSDFLSDFQSRVPKLVATNSQLSDLHSDLRSYLVGMSGMLSDVQSSLSNAHSDIISAIGNVSVALNASDISDISSAVLAGFTGISQSDISNIASAVEAILASRISDIYSAAQQTNSRALVLQSLVSDVDSALTSQFAAGVQLNASSLSDIRSAITAAAVSLDASTMSNIASQVWAHTVGARVDSRVLLTQSLVSDMGSYLVGMSGMLSDTHSAATQASSRALATFDQASDIYSLLSDLSSDVGELSGVLSGFESDFQSRFPATIPELTADPGATPTWAQAEALVFGWLKHDTTGTPTKRLLKNAAGATVLSGLVNWDGTLSVFNQGKLS